MDLTPSALGRWLPRLGALLAIESILVLLGNYRPLGPFDTNRGVLYGPMAMMLVLGVLTVRRSFRGIGPESALQIVWAAVVLKVGMSLLYVPWSRSMGQVALSLLSVFINLLVILSAPCLLGIALLRRSTPGAAHPQGRALATMLAAGLCGRALWIGVQSVRSFLQHGLTQWSSAILIIDSLLVAFSTAVLAWACIEELRPRSGGPAGPRRLFEAMMAWLAATAIHEAFGLYLSMFVFSRPFWQALPRVLPEPTWMLILALSTLCVRTPASPGYNFETRKHP